MPLPSVTKYGAKRCTANSKRTGLPCKNPAAYGCKVCRYHGAHPIKQGKDSPNYKHGRRTKQAELQHRAFTRRLQQIEDAMHLLGMTTAKRSRGRKARGYKKLKSLHEIR